MQQSRRDFAKKTAIVTAGAAVAAGTSVLAATGNSSYQGDSNNGVVKGTSRKKEILYKKTATWEEYYKNAK
ncbi:Tat pathway signal protein [Arcobacter sp. CECT 8983]|uniref:Tat pathway signal protein n=1 Tax=Arcobacter sp. CECT 8983 TaxID=2044508 RepID=UPI00100B9976|nr:Tat pathway signal protein [Arcobacter sp. CECT 8983]RXJ90773.1 Tat pathway signal protein [Arcobacter sp. CECT 8983]